MKASSHSMPEACPETSPSVQLVQVEVSLTHPLLLLKQALPWEAITEVMTRHWRQHGKNVDGGPGLPWDVSLYVPLVVLMLIKTFDSRQMEAYVAENVVARVFIGRHARCPGADSRSFQHRSGLCGSGQGGDRRGQPLGDQGSASLWLCRRGGLSADTTAQELPIGYPNEPGILRGLAQRCGRALTQTAQARGSGARQALWIRCRRSCARSKNTICLPGQSGQAPGVDSDIERGGRVDGANASADRASGAECGPGDAERALAADGDARGDQAADGADCALGLDGEGGGEQNRACGDSASPRHRAQQGGQEDGVWLGLSDQPLGRGLSVWER